GKTTLARMVGEARKSLYLDVESQADYRKLENPEMFFATLDCLVIIDEIQIRPELFAALRVVVDKPGNKCRFLVLGSASPDIIKNVSETLAGRVEFVDMAGFDIQEAGFENSKELFVRGGFPRSYLAQSDTDSIIWREGFIRTFLQRDIPQLGINIPAEAMRRFWTMLAHYHGQVWNASRLGAAMGLNNKTVSSYLDILTETYMIRQLQPWYENISKRQVKSPKIYFRDTGLLHSLLSVPDYQTLLGHPQVGACWEGFALEQILRILKIEQGYFWSTYTEAEIDLFFIYKGQRIGVEFKFSESPAKTRSTAVAMQSLALDKLFIVYPGDDYWPVADNVVVSSLARVIGELK
ncbi:MAG: ATP-binding protein, partial [Sedimentisphaerales bacterium]|nr:ATP-binding protein [Sedimentisphaerales bacterium]